MNLNHKGVIDLNGDTLKALYFLTYKTNLDTGEVYEAAKKFVDAYERERREKRHVAQKKPERAWSTEKHCAYGKLLDCIIGRMSPERVCDAAIELAKACKPEVEKPQSGEIYRDIFGNKYAVITVNEKFSDGTPINPPVVMLARIGGKGEYSLTDMFTPTLEDFMNPKFTKCEHG